MKKILLILLLAGCTGLTGCGTIFQGFKITEHQKAQRKKEVTRQIRPGILVLDIFCGIVPLIVDFATGAIYEKEPADTKDAMYNRKKKKYE